MTLNNDCENETYSSVTVAKNAGFCSGVRRAMSLALSTAEKHGKAYTIGRLVHNDDAISILESKNVFAVNDISEADENAVFVIRSHGVGKDVYDKLKDRVFYDATCPFVKKIHEIVETAVSPDSVVIIAGDKSHPEVKGIIGHIKSEYYIVNSDEELNLLLNINKNIRQNALIFVAQTTFNEYKWRDCIKIIKKHCTNLKIFDTICNATVERQERARELSKDIAKAPYGLMVVIGSKHSSNSVKLYEICKENCANTVFIENVYDSTLEKFSTRGACKIGITAGASVPAEIIKEVHNYYEHGNQKRG
ncbi:MAG: 4-hydroxy-3-methylbut-2-enyl diphosphate reductase [Oscillospiraceae bacterium]|nr:4-hydroxy-3-methylbut-2-enyl diphosphate reductase [Oscillospiraceae bacterium]